VFGVIVNEALAALERFTALYSPIGRPSILPEKLLRAVVLPASWSIRSERLLTERLEYKSSVLFRWFDRIGVEDAVLGPFGVLEEPRPAAGR
jgi:transposase